MNLLHDLHQTSLLKAQPILMLRLYTADGSGVPYSDLADSTGLPKSTISMTLDHLERGGVVERRLPARNQRASTIYLTDEGRADTEKMLAAMIAYVDDVKKREGRVHP